MQSAYLCVIFHVFLPTKLVSFFLFLVLPLSLLFTSMKTLKLRRKKESALLLFLFISKIPGGYAIYRQNARVLEMKNFTVAYMRGGRTYGRFS